LKRRPFWSVAAESRILPRASWKNFEKQALDAVAAIEQTLAAHDAQELARAATPSRGRPGSFPPRRSTLPRPSWKELGRAGTLDAAEDYLKQLRREVNACVAHVQTVKSQLTAGILVPSANNGRHSRAEG